MYWQLRAIARATGIPETSVTPAYLGDCLDYIKELVGGGDGQIQFHDQNYKRSRRLNQRLHKAALSMLGLMLVCITIHLLPHLFLQLGIALSWHEQLSRWLTLASATLPAFGAAMAGVSNQGEFARIEKRSCSVASSLGDFAREIDLLQKHNESGLSELRLKQVAELASRVTQLMVDEVVEWRVIFVGRPVTAARSKFGWFPTRPKSDKILKPGVGPDAFLSRRSRRDTTRGFTCCILVLPGGGNGRGRRRPRRCIDPR